MPDTDRKVTRWGDLEPGDQIRWRGSIITVTTVALKAIPATAYTRRWVQVVVEFDDGTTCARDVLVPQHLYAPATDAMRKLAPHVTTELMLNAARLDCYSLAYEVQHVEECEEMTDEEAETMAELVADLASRADITIKLPEATS
jgi:hypothetical protein